MNNRKLLLAYIRKGDHAHAGETEAIELALKDIPKDPNQHLLDVGCGLGGTANYIEKHGWGKVSGIDIDEEVINYARLHYPHAYFKQSDILNIATVFTNQKFDVFYSFNAYFCFKSQAESLKAMQSVAKTNAELVIFDYSSPDSYTLENPFCDRYAGSVAAQFFKPINISTIEKELQETGWKLKQIIDLSEKFEGWYQWLITKMENQKLELVGHFGEDVYDDLYQGYCRLLKLIREKKVGGAVLRADLY